MPNANEKMRVYCLGLSCAQAIYSSRAPTLAYAVRVADQLFMTAAHESALVYRRQGVFIGKDTRRGAWSLYQVEWGSMESSLRYAARKDEMVERSLRWLSGFHGRDLRGAFQAALVSIGDLPVNTPADGLHDVSPWVRLLALMLEPTGDPLGCLFARLHYARVPEPIPKSPEAQAIYAKEHFNTPAGKATANKYLEAFNRMCPWPPDERF